MKIISLFFLTLISFTLMVKSQGFFSNFNQPDLPGERRAVVDIELKGLAINAYTVKCYYSTDSMKVVRALNNLSQPGDVSIATANKVPLGSDRMRCSIIFPHSRHPNPNSNDVNPQQIGAPNKVYYAWVRSHSRADLREPISITSTVSGFKMPRMLIISYSGDSYASGEGAPNAVSLDVNDRWDMEDGVNGNCHRSNKSGGELAIRKLRREHPEWAIKYVNVTCSGALLQDFYDFRSRGGSNGALRPQLEQIKEKIGSRTIVDIFLSDGGGNDVILVDIGVNALTDIFGDICNDAAQQKTLNDVIAYVPDRYELISNILKTGKNPVTNKDLGYSVKKIVWFNYPSPLTDKDGRLCSPGTNGVNPLDCWGPLEMQISDCDWRWLRDNIFPKINGVISEVVKDNKDNNWSLVDISSKANKHGMCNCDEPYFNTLGQSLFTQVDERGTMHPNATGFEKIYRDPICDKLEETIQEYHSELSSRRSVIPIKLINPADLTALQTSFNKVKLQKAIVLVQQSKKKSQIESIKKSVKAIKPKGVILNTDRNNNDKEDQGSGD